MNKREILELLELAYAPADSTGDWLERFGMRLARSLDWAVLPFGYVFDGGGEGPPEFHQAFFGPGADLGGRADALSYFRETHASLDRAMLDAFFPVGTASSLFSERYTSGVELGSATPSEDIDRLVAGARGDDSWALYSVDARRRGVVCGSITRGPRLRERDREQHRRLAVHLAAGLRLRESVFDAARVSGAEAILNPDGSIAEAWGAGVAGREPLTAAVARVERARSVRRSRGEEPLELWQGLVEGRWSVVDHEDRDGRRYYLAIANPPLAVLDRALGELEAEAAALAIAGESNKVIAYSLGLAESTVAGLLSAALVKLGVRSRVDLIRVGAALGVRAESEARRGGEASALEEVPRSGARPR